MCLKDGDMDREAFSVPMNVGGQKNLHRVFKISDSLAGDHDGGLLTLVQKMEIEPGIRSQNVRLGRDLV